jgi:hypothetical protein
MTRMAGTSMLNARNGATAGRYPIHHCTEGHIAVNTHILNTDNGREPR